MIKRTNYGFSKVLSLSYEEALEKVKESLGNEGFGVVTDIDMAATLKMKLQVERKPYRILGACHPPSAYKALMAEEEIGLMLPCNVIVYVRDDEKTIVAAINPEEAMAPVKNSNLSVLAAEIGKKLQAALQHL